MKLYIFFDCDGEGEVAIVPAETEDDARKQLSKDGYDMPKGLQIYDLGGGPIYYDPYAI